MREQEKIVKVTVEIEDSLYDDETPEEAADMIRQSLLDRGYYRAVRVLAVCAEELSDED